jgi:hypothetical protein
MFQVCCSAVIVCMQGMFNALHTTKNTQADIAPLTLLAEQLGAEQLRQCSAQRMPDMQQQAIRSAQTALNCPATCATKLAEASNQARKQASVELVALGNKK